MPLSEATDSRSPARPQLHCGRGWSGSSSPSIGIGTWPNSPAIPDAPRTIWPRSTTPPPRPVPTMAATDERCWRVGAEEVFVGVQRGGVAVVVVDHRQSEARLGRRADVVAAPRRLLEVGRALRRDHARGTGRARRVETDGEHDGIGDATGVEGDVHRRDDGVEGGVGPVADQARDLRHPIDQERAGEVDDGGVGLRAADVDADDDDGAAAHSRRRQPRPRVDRSGVRAARAARSRRPPRRARGGRA